MQPKQAHRSPEQWTPRTKQPTLPKERRKAAVGRHLDQVWKKGQMSEEGRALQKAFSTGKIEWARPGVIKPWCTVRKQWVWLDMGHTGAVGLRTRVGRFGHSLLCQTQWLITYTAGNGESKVFWKRQWCDMASCWRTRTSAASKEGTSPLAVTSNFLQKKVFVL